MNEIVRISALDGVWEVGGADRRRGIWPEELNCTWDKVGAKTGQVHAGREAGAPTPDLTAFTPVEIEKNGLVGWEGYITSTPEQDDYAVSVECAGWQDHLDDDLVKQKTFVHSKLTDWVDVRSDLAANLATHRVGPQVEVGDGAIVLSLPKSTDITAGMGTAVALDLGQDNGARRISISFQWDPAGASAFIGSSLYVMGTSIMDWTSAYSERIDYISNSLASSGGSAVNTASASISSARRYVVILWWNPTINGTMGIDAWLRISAMRVYADPAYESGHQSILKGDTVIKDALPVAPLLDSQGGSYPGIEPVSFVWPEFTMSDDRTPREIWDAIDVAHRYVKKIAPGRRPVWKPQPTVPLLTAGDWPGVNFSNTSKNDSSELYNKGVGKGVEPYGTLRRVERHAGQSFGLGAFAHHQPVNGTFQTNLDGWITVGSGISATRDLGYYVPPASMNIYCPPGLGGTFYTQTFGTNFGGNYTFQRGRSYRMMFWVYTFTNLSQFYLQLGQTNVPGNFAQSGLITPPLSVWTQYQIVWTPTISTSGGIFVIQDTTQTTLAHGYLLDDFQCTISAPTLLDRRGRTRAKSIELPSQAVNTDVLTQFADIWLTGHVRAPLRGELAVTGRGLRNYQSGQSVDPFEVGLYTSELVHLGGEIDPDTGAIGRDAPIAQVSYDAQQETASVSLDATRENFEAVVSRYDLVAGSGRT